MGDAHSGKRWWRGWRRRRPPRADPGAAVPPDPAAGPHPGGVAPAEDEGMFMQQAPGSTRWEEVPLWPLDRRVRVLFRQLAAHWGSSRGELRLVSLPVLLWITQDLAVAAPGGVTVLARARPDRRVQIHHANRDQILTFSAGRLEWDSVAAWTNPLRRALFDWLSAGVAVTGADIAVLSAGPARWHGQGLEAMGCALACCARPWERAGVLDRTRQAVSL
ncbi:MAG: hypothetical protein AB1609_16475, partial [Bacillota bacterium]